MRDFFRSPLFRCLVCLILVCCILVNVSPIRAKASVSLTAAGVIALIYAACAGAVIIPSSIAIANAIGKKVDEEIQIRVAPELVDAWNNLTDRYDNLVPEWDPGEWHNDLKTALAGGLLAAITSIMVGLVTKGAMEVVGDSADDGWAYYNNWPFPVIPETPYTGYDYSCIVLTDSDSFYLYYGSQPAKVTKDINFGYPAGSKYAGYLLDNQTWVLKFTVSGGSSYPYTVLWSNHDVYDDAGNLIMAASEPSSTQTITVEPDIYVGDLPDQIKSGEKDENNLELPIIDPWSLISDPSTGFDDVTNTLQQLKDGTITYEEYIDTVTADDETQVDPSGPTDPTDPTEDPEAIPEDMAPYIFDLREIFPFCIPFDLYDFLTCLDATPEAPVINWEIQLPGGSTYPITVDLSPFDSVAQLLRRLELLVFSIALGIKTRDLIKG